MKTGIKNIDEIFRGQVEITKDIAEKLEKGTGVISEVWLDMDLNYRGLLHFISTAKSSEKIIESLSKTIKDARRF